MAVADIAHLETDKTIEEIERRLQKEYSQAQKEVEHKYNVYMQQFKGKDAEKRQLLDAGKITKQEYQSWRYGQVCVGNRWKTLKEELAQDLTTVDMKARSIMQGYMPEVYAINHNYATYQGEHDAMVDTSYTLYNAEAVENLIRNDDTLLPYPRKDSPTELYLRENKDKRWNQEHIHSAITQGVLQGEPIPKIAQRLERVVGMDRSAAIRNARTMMTGVENKARVDAYDRLRSYGVEIEEVWVATLDDRTRDSHRAMDGQVKDPKTGEYDNGLRYPGDPSGEPEEVYNCRCHERPFVGGIRRTGSSWLAGRSSKLGSMSYAEWKRGKSQQDEGIIKDGTFLFGTERLEHKDIINALNGSNAYHGESNGYSRNCQRCVIAYEARRRGYNVTALPKVKEKDSESKMKGKNGWAAVFKNGVKKLESMSGTTVSEGYNNIKNTMFSYGDGARAIVRIKWISGKGHTFIAEQVGGNTLFLDPQNSGVAVDYYFNDKYMVTDDIFLLRTDDKKIVGDIARFVER